MFYFLLLSHWPRVPRGSAESSSTSGHQSRPKLPPLLPPSILINARPFRPRATPINSPAIPLWSPFPLLRRHQLAVAEFLVDARRYWWCAPLIPTSTRSLAALFRFPSISLAPTHLPDPSSLNFFAGNRATRPRSKLTRTPHISSRRSLRHLEAIEEGDHTPKSATPSSILSWRRRRPGATRSSPEINQSHLTGLSSPEP
jgi:hypothetical protein